MSSNILLTPSCIQGSKVYHIKCTAHLLHVISIYTQVGCNTCRLLFFNLFFVNKVCFPNILYFI